MADELRILIVEDEPDDAELMLRALQRDGIVARTHRASMYEDVRDALDCVSWDVILCDHHSLPGYRSTDVLQMAALLAPRTPFIVVSGALRAQEAVDLVHRGAASYVDKGDLTRLAPTIRRVLEQAKHQLSDTAMQGTLEILRIAMDGASDPICVLQFDGTDRPRAVFVNPACERLALADDRGTLTAVEAARATNGPALAEVQRRDGSGELLAFEVCAGPVASGSRYYVAIARDVTARKRGEAELAHLASHDALTGLPNRAFFEARLSLALTEARNASTYVGVVMLDLDGFKAINDEQGHHVGDALLCAFSGRLRQRIRPKDTVARVSGDEFVLVIPAASLSEVDAAAQRVVADVTSEPFVVGARTHRLGVSAGVAVFPSDAVDGPTLVRHADTAMYQAKAWGKDGIISYRDLTLADAAS